MACSCIVGNDGSGKREERAANEPFGQDWCEIFAPLRILNTLRRMKVLPMGGCIVCDQSDVSVGIRVLPCSHRCVHAPRARVASRAPLCDASLIP